jgi:hypothetical protein
MSDIPQPPSDTSSTEDDLVYWTEKLCTFTKEDSYFDILEAANGFDEAMKDIKAPEVLDSTCRKEVIYTLIDLVGKKSALEMTQHWKQY